METFDITNSTLNTAYVYRNDTLYVSGSYSKDATTDTLQNISGTIYLKTAEGEQGNYVGNFNGYNRDGEIRYNISEVTYQQSQQAWEAINAIERNITGNNSEEE